MMVLTRGLWGLALLRLDQPAARVLGARHVVEAIAIGARPRLSRACGVVDLVHAASMLTLAALRSRWRAPALASAAVAVVLGTATLDD